MLMNHTYSELNIPRQSADFRPQTTWRMKLRDTSQYEKNYMAQAGPESIPAVDMVSSVKKKNKKKKKTKASHQSDDHVGPLLHFFLNAGGPDDQFAIVEERRKAKGPMEIYDRMKEKKRQKESGADGGDVNSGQSTELSPLRVPGDKKKNLINTESARKLRRQLLRQIDGHK